MFKKWIKMNYWIFTNLCKLGYREYKKALDEVSKELEF